MVTNLSTLQSNYLISCDWGTSRFRLRVLESATLSILTEIKTSKGISVLSAAFEQSSLPSLSRGEYYLRYLQEQINAAKTTLSLPDNTPVIVSGMASSTIGIQELPYSTVPCSLSGETLITQWIASGAFCTHPVLLISGVASNTDIMRGEETQVIGLQHLRGYNQTEVLYILPGTHSKHIVVKDNTIISFRTFITGELFDLLTTSSILRDSVSASGAPHLESHNISFIDGVSQSGKAPLSHALFSVRTNVILKKYSRESNYLYLSGLLIGEELNAIAPHSDTSIYLSADAPLLELYRIALDHLGHHSNVTVVPSFLADSAIGVAHSVIYKTRSHGH